MSEIKRGPPTALEQRFWAKVQIGPASECWPWLGYTRESGHGLTSYKSLCIHAHRKAWILTHGPIPCEQCVNHRCDNPLCCNPGHMYLGTRVDNMIDYWHGTAPEDRSPRGRPHVLDDAALERLWQRRREGATLKQCASEFGIHLATVCRYISTRRRQKIERLSQVRLSNIRKSM